MRPWQSILLALACLACTAAAMPRPPSADAITVGNPEPQSFDVFAGNADASTANRGMIGGGGYYHATVTIAPRYEVPGDGTVKIILDGERVTAKTIQRQDPGGLALLTWSFDLMDMDSPARLVKRVTARFDGASVTSDTAGAQTYVFKIPAGSTRLEGFVVDWAWLKNEQSLQFKGDAPVGGGWRNWALALAALALAAFLFYRFRKPPAAAKPANKGEEDEEEERETYEVDAHSQSTFRFAGPGQSDIALNYDDGQGLIVHGRFDSQGSNRWTGGQIAIDTQAETANLEFFALHLDRTTSTDPNLPGPTIAAAEAYFKAMLVQNVAVAAGDLPGQDSNRARAPIILSIVSRDPHAGRTLEMRGIFGKDGAIEVSFNVAVPGVPAAPGQAPPTIPVRHVAEILSDTPTRLIVRIPPGIQGKFDILVKRGTLTSEPRKFKVYRPGEMPSFADTTAEQLVDTVIASTLTGEAFQELIRLGHVITRKEGRFRYLLGSKTEEVDRAGARVRSRWLVMLDGELKNKLKQATFTIGVALVGSGESDTLLDGDDSIAQRFVRLLQVDIDKEGGDKVYNAQLFPGNEDLASALGIQWNQDDKTITLTQLLRFDLPESGIKLYFDTAAKQVGLDIGEDGRGLSLRAGEGGVMLANSETETRTVDGYEQQFKTTQAVEDGKITLTHRASFALSSGQSLDQAAGNRLDFELQYADHNDDRPIADLAAKIEMSMGSVVRSSMAAKVNENRLSEFDSALALSRGRDSVGANFKFVRPVDPASRALDKEIYSLGLAAETRVFDGDLGLAVRGVGTVERERGSVRALELTAGLELEVRKSVKANFGIEGSYRRQFGSDGGESYRLTAYGEKEILKTDLRLGLTYSRDADRDALSLVLGIDPSSTAERIFKLLKQEKTTELRIFEGERPR